MIHFHIFKTNQLNINFNIEAVKRRQMFINLLLYQNSKKLMAVQWDSLHKSFIKLTHN